MGFLSYLQSKFGKNILVKGDISSHLVFVYKPKKGKIWLGSKIVVPEGFAFLIGKNGKVLDYFSSGEYELKGIFLPKCVKKFNLTKANKDGSFPNAFSADAYFVNLSMFEYEGWKTRKIDFFDAKYGYFKAGFSGGFAFQVADAELFMKTLLKVYDFIKQNEAANILSSFLSEYVVEQIEKAKLDYTTASNAEKLTDFLFEPLVAKCLTIGVDLVGFKIEKIKFASNFTKKVEQINLDEQFVLRGEELEKEQEQVKPYFKVETPLPTPESFLQNSLPKQMANQQKPMQNEKEVVKAQKSLERTNHSNEFVDLEAVPAYNEHNQFVRCIFCGAKNSKGSHTCTLCGENLKRESS